MSLPRRWFPVLAICLAAAAAVAQSSAPPGLPPNLDGWVVRAMREFQAPGIGLAIVKDGKVVLATGYGIRKLGEPTKVDQDTLFGIASNTKVFTATLLAQLVDEGRIKWDDPVVNYLPGFQMSDPYVTSQITVRDLLVHRSGLGLGEGDLMYFPHSDYTRDQIVQRVRYLKLANSFRGHYAYDNVLYIVAGQLIAHLAGKSWDEVVRERIFQPLGMNHSNSSVHSLQPGINYATPTATVEGKLQPVSFDDVDNTAAAGAINSSAADMAKWVLTQLGHGQEPGGPRIFSDGQSRELWTGVTILPMPREVPAGLAPLRPHFAEYALGLGVRDYRGRKIVAHTGGLTGYTSRVLMVPEENLGIVVLTNGENPEGHEAIAWHIVDHYLEAPAHDWIAAFEDLKKRTEGEGKATEAKEKAGRNANSRPSLPLSGYTGQYQDSWYGTADIQQDNGGLMMRFSHTPALTGRLEHFQYDTFIAHWVDKTTPDAYVTFQLTPDGKVDQIKMKPVSPLADFSYDYQDLLFKPVATPEKRASPPAAPANPASPVKKEKKNR